MYFSVLGDVERVVAEEPCQSAWPVFNLRLCEVFPGVVSIMASWRWFCAAIVLLLSLTSLGHAEDTRIDDVARLSDEQVRELLLAELDQEEVVEEPGFFENPAMKAYLLQQKVTEVADRLQAKLAVYPELPEVFRKAGERLSQRPDGTSFGMAILSMLASLAMGLCAEALLRASLADRLRHLRRQATHRVAAILLNALMLGAGLALSAIITLVMYLALFSPTVQDRVTFFFYLSAYVVFRLAALISKIWHSPHQKDLRLPLLSDQGAHSLHNTFMVTVFLGAFGFYSCALFASVGVGGEAHGLLLIIVGTVTTLGLMISFLWNREAMTGMIMGRGGGYFDASRLAFATIWPWFLAGFTLLIWCYLVITQLAGDHVGYGAALFTLALAALLPSCDAILANKARAAETDEIYSAVLTTLRLVIPFVSVILLAFAWRVDLLSIDSDTLSGWVTLAALKITATGLFAFLIWQLFKVSIDRAIRQEDEEMARLGQDLGEMEIGGAGLSRLRTLLPLIRGSIRITLVTIGLMIVLSALGVDIAPILAGAGVVGLAIGFGSQTLVRDIVSGAFFLIDDAFRLGEYIDVGSVKGSVEHMSIRSVRLRHHRGALHTVPYGEVTHLTNHSRDWAIMKLRFRVPFGADIERIRKMFKRIGQELAQMPELKDDFIQPFKSQGVLEVDDYGLVIRAKFMSKPGRQFIIRRHAFRAVQEAFAEAGIEFATPEVRVVVDDEDEKELPEEAQARIDAMASAASSHLVARNAAEAAKT